VNPEIETRKEEGYGFRNIIPRASKWADVFHGLAHAA
jgi:hypothetical protein